MHLFIDTTEFDRLRKNVFHKSFKRVQSLVQEERVVLAVPYVTFREWQSHLTEAVDGWIQGTRKALGSLEARAGCPDTTEGGYLSTLKERSLAALDDLLRPDGRPLLSGGPFDIDALLDSYFSGSAPFDDGRKKHEFPDAIAAAYLTEHARKHSVVVTVVSRDSDWKRVCSRYPSQLHHVSSIDEALEKELQEHEESTFEAIKQELHRRSTELLSLELIRSKLEDVEVDFDEEDRADVEVVDVNIVEVLERTLHIVDYDREQGMVGVGGDLRLRISVEFTSGDYSLSVRDGGDDFFVFRQTELVSATVTTDIDGYLEIGDSATESLEWGELELATSGCIAMEQFVVTSTSSTADDAHL